MGARNDHNRQRHALAGHVGHLVRSVRDCGDIRGDGVVSVAYDGGTLVLKAREAPKLGREPYTPLVPWGQTAYFDLNADSLAQLARSRQLQLILRGADSNPVVFDPGGPTSVTLKTFASSRGITVD